MIEVLYKAAQKRRLFTVVSIQVLSIPTNLLRASAPTAREEGMRPTHQQKVSHVLPARKRSRF
jgi:hypothetical protein